MFSFLRKKAVFAVVPLTLAGLFFASCEQPAGNPDDSKPVNAQQPAITTRPSGGTWDVGTTESFQLTVAARVTDGGTLSYQWYTTDSSTNNTGGSIMQEKTEAALILNKTDYAENGDYYFFVTVTNSITDNGDGGAKTAHATSIVATVNVTGNATNPEPGPVSVTFNSVSAGPSNLPDTTVLTLAFDKPIPGLSADDITLSGVSGVSKGTLSGSGPSYTLPITAPSGGTLSVAVAKAPNVMSGSPKEVAITGGNAVPLVENQWADGDVPNANDVDWYTISVANGTNYYFWWNDKGAGNDTKTGDIDVSAYYSDGSGVSGWPSAEDRAWNTPKSFTAARTGTVYVRARPFGNSAGFNYEGTYGIVYSTTNARPPSGGGDPPVTGPLTDGVWRNDELTSSIRSVEYAFAVENGKTYYVWWNDSHAGPAFKDKTLDIRCSARYSGETAYIFGGTGDLGVDTGWFIPRFFTASRNGSVTVVVTPFYEDDIGTFAVVYSTVSIRPGAAVKKTITADQWADDTISTDEIHVYAINVTQNQTYNVWWNDKDLYEGDGTKTADVQVQARYADETLIFKNAAAYADQWVNVAWTTPQSFTADRTGTVDLRVRPYSETFNSVGTYGIVYSTGSTMPDKEGATLISVTPNGGSGTPTTELTLLFNEPVFGLGAGDITLAMPSPFGVTKGTLSGDGPTYTLEVGSPIDGTLTVTVGTALLSISGSPKEVSIYGDNSITVKPLVENQWANGNLPTASSVDWYSFAVTASTTYRIWWNDADEGNWSKTGDVGVGAWYADGTNIFDNEDYGFYFAQVIPVTADGTVYVKVMPFNGNPSRIGTYGIVYSTGTSMP